MTFKLELSGFSFMAARFNASRSVDVILKLTCTPLNSVRQVSLDEEGNFVFFDNCFFSENHSIFQIRFYSAVILLTDVVI